ncbi:MAG: hypothetical protein ACI3XM_01135 [Eubacteriales bacterium]
MRFDTPVYFQRVTQGAYNAETGNYDPDTVEEKKRYADVTGAGTETLRLLYGEIRQGTVVIRLQTAYTDPFDQIRIGDKIYRNNLSRPLRNKHIFIASEVQ